ncbi:hypothetical protein Q7C30_006370 [Pseudomonas sp. RAC1]|uniref:hypothetical protein n=1 Tax=Pseudomonas sp. RAC1 TaxID=3064900 RepID=UPI002720858C|nr:hypothetical protein [Pseudomonas sp. RAC1]MDV9031722.1 hypothetical protein [Pseudomonas sp. RAC1]
MKEFLDRLLQMAQILSLLAIPVLVAVYGYLFQSEAKEKEINRDFVQMAVSILSTPSPKSGDEAPLRDWASRMLAHASPVPFKAKELDDLRNNMRAISDLVRRAECRHGLDSIQKPEWAASSIREDDSLEVKVRALLAERRQRIGYERELEAAVGACR